VARRNLTFREDRLEFRHVDEGGGGNAFAIEVPSDRWRFGEGDTAIFFRGRGRGVSFRAWATVLRTARSDRSLSGKGNWWTYTVVTEQETAFPEDRTLDNFAYSLPRISNLRDPWRHIGHRWQLSDLDLEILTSGEVHAPRTFYFGLLAALDRSWALPLDRAANARRLLTNALDPDFRARPDDGARVEELRELLTHLVVEPARLAHEIGRMHAQLFEGALSPELDMGENLPAFSLRPRERGVEPAAAQLTASFIDALETPASLFEGAPWRPPRL
jgi:hypothetical protein